MLAINAETLRAMISRESGMRAARQQEIVEGMGAPMAGVLGRLRHQHPASDRPFPGAGGA